MKRFLSVICGPTSYSERFFLIMRTTQTQPDNTDNQRYSGCECYGSSCRIKVSSSLTPYAHLRAGTIAVEEYKQRERKAGHSKQCQALRNECVGRTATFGAAGLASRGTLFVAGTAKKTRV
jgi:hypothetical protein